MSDSSADGPGRMLEEQLRGRGIRDPAVLDAMAAVPRDRFLPPEQRHRAWEDRALPLARGQTVSQPYIVAAMTEAISPRPGDRVLDVGTGSGYQAAILAHMGAEVHSVERLPDLAEGARARLRELGYGEVRVHVGDGTLGWEAAAPYRGIVVAAAAPRPPPPLLDQLDPEGGRLVVPVGSRDLQQLVRVERQGTEFRREDLMPCRFVPLVGEQGWEA